MTSDAPAIDAAWACPAHGTELVQQDDLLTCEAGETYPVVREIPRFVSGSNYADHFGAQWNRFRETQLDSRTGLPISRARLEQALGESLWNPLGESRVLECGCGAGRFTEILLDRGARVTAVDLSDAVDASRLNFPGADGLQIAQADVRHLPARPQSFQLVLCLGMIQHTPNPEETIAALYRYVAPGGWLAFDHYELGLAYYASTLPLLRRLFLRMSPERSLRATERLVDALLPIHRRFARSTWGYRLLTRLSPVRSYYHAYPELDETYQRLWSILDTHDALTDTFKHSRSPEAIRATLEWLGATNLYVARGGNGVQARAQRPAMG
jgi:2-polyprenyl-3-methyl-5-hydroxy-6-metoxy-1,4-benzoquinol methylase